MSTQNTRSTTTIFDKSVAWITPFLGRDGQLMYMGPLLSELSKHCKSFCVITAEYSGNPDNSPFSIIVASAVRRVYWRGRDNYLKGFTFIGPGFLKTILSSRADVLFLVEFSLTTIYGTLLKLFSGRPVKIILVMEGRPVPNEGKILAFLKALLRRFIVSRADAILTNNRSGRDYLVRILHADPDRIITKPYLVSTIYGQNTPDAEPVKYSLLDSSSIIRFLFVGRLISAKGLQHLIAAVSLLGADERNRIAIDIVGEGDYRKQLTELVHTSGLDDCFQFHGSIDYEELPEFYNSAHVFIYPTLRDYRALAPFEALSAGLPIISSIHDGGITENVLEGENGFCCDPRDEVKLSSIISRILSEPVLLKRFSLKSTQMAKSYTIDNAVNNIITAANLATR